MQRIISIVVMTFAVFLVGCVAPVVPEFSGQAPKPIHSATMLRQAIELALADEGWEIISIQHQNILQAYKQKDDQSASVYIVYGSEGYSMEYATSQHMQYDAIDPLYRKWVYSLNSSIEYQLKQQTTLLKNRY